MVRSLKQNLKYKYKTYCILCYTVINYIENSQGIFRPFLFQGIIYGAQWNSSI